MQPGAALLVPGDVLDRYEVLFEIARGGMAAVYAARRAGTAAFDRVVALKVPHPHLRSERRYVDLFLNEAKIASVIEHPNVVQVFDLGEHDGVPYLVMEYVRGRALAQVLARVAAPEVRLLLALEVIACAAEGLHAAHTARGPDGLPLGIVHRDVSPQNVLVGYGGQVKVADFGIAHAHDRPVVTRTGELRGKLQYLAPEQISREDALSARTDVWALGVMVWETVMGRALFLGATDAETMWNVCAKTCPSIELPGFLSSTPLAALVDACLRRRPAERPASAAEVATSLRESLRRSGRGIDIAQTMGEAFAAEITEDHRRLAAAFARRGALPVASAAPPERSLAVDAAPRVEAGTPSLSNPEGVGLSPVLALRPPEKWVPWRSGWAWGSLAAAGVLAWMINRAPTSTTTAQVPSASIAAAAPSRERAAPTLDTKGDALPAPSAGIVSSARSANAVGTPSSAAPASSAAGRRVPGASGVSSRPSPPRSPLLANPYASPAGSR